MARLGLQAPKGPSSEQLAMLLLLCGGAGGRLHCYVDTRDYQPLLAQPSLRVLELVLGPSHDRVRRAWVGPGVEGAFAPRG